MENVHLPNEEALFAYAAKVITLIQLEEWTNDPALETEIVRSPASEKRMKHLFAKARRAEKWAMWETQYKPMKRTLTALAASLALVTCLFAPVHAVQQAVISTVISWYEKFVSFSFLSDSSYVVSLTDNFSVGYWPEGYDKIVNAEKNRFMFSEARVNINGDVTSIYAKVLETLLDANLDNENAKISTNFSFNEKSANLSVSEDGVTHLLWYDGNILLEVSSKENLNEIMKIIESIKY
ncbi:MAG: DUF4367 domain-containing protein [Oscillospiraceae bacterium]